MSSKRLQVILLGADQRIMGISPALALTQHLCQPSFIVDTLPSPGTTLQVQFTSTCLGQAPPKAARLEL